MECCCHADLKHQGSGRCAPPTTFQVGEYVRLTVGTFVAFGGRAQTVGQKAFAGLGVRHARDKRQRMGPSTEFLGIVHDLSVVVDKQMICHWPEQQLQEKTRELILDRTQENTCTPAQAGKLRGICG